MNPLHQPVRVIFDTDMGPDYDDVGALAMLHALADQGEAEILATVACNKHPLVAPCIEVINTYFGRPDIPIGASKSAAVTMGASQKWPEAITAAYPHRLTSTDEAPDAIALYRRILSSQPDSSVTIISVGFLTNLAYLLRSPADSISSMTGRELVAIKVKNLVVMAGQFPEGREFNIEQDTLSAKEVSTTWPTPIIFSGFEIGVGILTGKRLVAASEKSPIKDAFRISMLQDKEDKNGHSSWDQTAVLVGVRGATPYFDLVPGRFVLQHGGRNSWDASKHGHFYVVQKMPATQVAAIIEELMMRKALHEQ